ncbi:MAG: phospholipase [Muribaculaceae bacterium]|nr:phospholipase [Muribaculaceae bacterium]
MTVSLIILAALLAVGLPLYLHHRWENRRRTAQGIKTEEVQEPVQECCGLHMTCEKDSLLVAVSPEVVYYDDEELDIFKGRTPDSYSDEEIEIFRDVLFTMLPKDIAGWARSLQLREISMPEIVREELLMIVSEARNNRNNEIK